MIAHCLFEQSGTFKNEFKKLGFESYDYDIQNKFEETDFVIDLYNEIDKAYKEEKSIFDTFSKDDIIMAFFPCIRFSVNAQLLFNCATPQLKQWELSKKLEYNIKLQEELSHNYILISKMVIVCLRKNLKMIIENPYAKEHYLTKYWAFKSSLIDYNRSLRGDHMKKPTQYWFVNCKPKLNYINEKVNIKDELIREKDVGTSKRSNIHSDYARRFIKEFIL
ncbi:hypothetical protein IKD48_00735 [bacterium]|nr:hypothetical protein [bacterium]